MKIALDLDGVCFDFASNMRDWLEQHHCFDPKRLPTPDRWDMWDAWSMSKDQWHRYFDGGVGSGFLFTGGDRYLYPGAKPAVEALAAAGHEIHVISHRPQAAHLATRQWLAEVGIPFDSLTFSADKTAVRCDVIIEDNVDNCLAVISAGGKAILMDRPWNIVWDIGNGPESPSKYRGLTRANNWPHVLHAVASMTPRTFPREAFDVVGCETGPKPWVVDAHGLGAKVRAALDAGARRGVGLNPGEYVASAAEVRVTSATGGAKGSKPARFDMIPPDVLWELAEHYGKGEVKYPSDPETGEANWQKGYAWSLSAAALMRHWFAWLAGEDIDPETGSSHLVAVMWHAQALRWWQLHDRGTDDIAGRRVTA